MNVISIFITNGLCNESCNLAYVFKKLKATHLELKVNLSINKKHILSKPIRIYMVVTR